MSFYQLLFSRKLNGINRNLTWYWNLFAKYMRENVGTLLAKILKIKGNTIEWNQTARPLESTYWEGNLCTTVFSNNSVLCTMGSTVGAFGVYRISATNPANWKVGHKYYISFEFKTNKLGRVRFPFNQVGYDTTVIAINTWQKSTFIAEAPSGVPNTIICYKFDNLEQNDTLEVKNLMRIDLTQMFGAGKEPSTVEEFTSLFPSYYAYDSGSLLSFNGSGIKTTGKNVLDSHNNTYNALPITVTDITFSATDNGGIHVQGTASAQRRFYFRNSAVPYSLPYDVVVSSIGISSTGVGLWGASKSLINGGTISANTNWGDFFLYVPQGATVDTDVFVQVEMGDSPTSYEPYTSSTKSLPISTYFPDGMLSAGSVYDELTPTKATKRLMKVAIDGTNKVASYYGVYNNHQLFYYDVYPSVSVRKDPTVLLTNLYTTSVVATMDNKCCRYQGVPALDINTGRVFWNDDSYTSASAMNTALQSKPLEIVMWAETETETTIDPPLDLSYEIEWGGTEQLLPENTSTPTTSPISATVEYPDGEHEDYYTYQEIEKNHLRLNRALSIMLGRNVIIENPQEPLDIIMRGE